jgi:antitoxin (DNA-binding transcriptional repressor) of toxin-antitoxin stability system
MNLWRKATYSILALSMASAGSLSGGALANSGGLSVTYTDVTKDAPWALEYIAEQVQRGVFTGYGDGTFRPNATITRIEAIVAAVRHMGARAEAEAETAMLAKLKAKDGKFIQANYAWAVGYVAIAEKYNLLSDESAALQPGASADRLWATMLLVRASGLEREAKDQKDAGLPFDDRDSVPVEAAGYVAVANAKGIVTGYEDDTFRPAKTVSRAELAALLDRAGDAMPEATDDAFVQLDGTVTSIVTGKAMITKNGASQWFTIQDKATVIRGQQLVTAKQLQIGDEVDAVLANTHLVHIHVTKASSGGGTAIPDPAVTTGTTGTNGQTGTGSGAATSPGTSPAMVMDGTKAGSVISRVGSTLTMKENGAAVSYTIDANVLVTRNRITAILNDVAAGDEVTVIVTNGRIVQIAAMPGQVDNGRIVGTVKSVTADHLTVTANGTDFTYTVSTDVVVIVNQLPGIWRTIRVGDQITAVITGGAVYHATVSAVANASTEITGYVSAIYGNQVMISANGRSTIYNVRVDAHLFRAGAEATVQGLVPGDLVKVLLQDGSIYFLTVLTPYEIDPNYQIIEGTYLAHTIIADKMRQITLGTQLEGNTIMRVYDIPEDAMLLGSATGTGTGTGKPLLFTTQMKIKLTLIQKIVKLVEIVP